MSVNQFRKGLRGVSKQALIGVEPRELLLLTSTDANTIYVNRPSSHGTAWSARMQRNLGGSDSTDLGDPHANFRRTGSYELPSVTSDPTAPLYTLGADIGAFDYALQETTTGLTGGSYHGGAVPVFENWYADDVLVDPLSGTLRAKVFKFANQVTITYGPGITALVDYLLTFNADGTLYEDTTVTSTAAFANTAYIHMEIVAYAFTQAIADGGAPTDISAITDHAFGTTGDLKLLNPSTGHSVRVVTDANLVPGYKDTLIRTTADRQKFYFHQGSTAGAAWGTKRARRTISFAKS
jgi:hypothetical protein